MNPASIATWLKQIERCRRCDELDLVAAQAHVDALAKPETSKWLEGHCGPHWRRLGLGARRGYLKPEENGETFWDLRDSASGVWVVTLPMLGFDAAGIWSAVDLLAIDPDGERVGSLTGAFDGVLGELVLLSEATRHRIFARPLDWLRFAADPANDLAPAVDGEGAPVDDVPVHLSWPDAPAARALLIGATEIVAPDDDTAGRLDRRIRSLRKAALPPAPRISVLQEG